MPPQHRRKFGERCNVPSTYDVVSGLLVGARRSVRIFSPYVDPTFTALVQGVGAQVPVRVVTTSRERRTGRANAVLERCALDRDLQVRYVVERRNRAQMFQMHAKLVCVDARAAYVGSANLTDTSIHYNLELGLLTEDAREVAVLEAMFTFVWDQLGLPAQRI